MSEVSLSEDSQQEVPGKRGLPAEFQGLQITLEWKAGDTRTFERPDYPSMYMYADYGEINNTVSNEEGDALDCFLPKDGPVNDSVFIAVMDDDTGQFEEEKVFLGFEDQKAVQFCFTQHYGEEKLRFIYQMSVEDFKKMLEFRAPEAALKNGPLTDVEPPPETMKKGLTRVPLSSLVGALNQRQVATLVELRKSTRVVGKGEGRIWASIDPQTGLFDPKDLLEMSMTKGVSGSGHSVGSPFSARKLSYDEYGILVLKSDGVAPETIAKALGLGFDEVVGKLKGWMVIPRG